MSEYTEGDFRNAGFAVLPKYGLRAHKSAGDVYWQRDGIKRATNAEMAEAGWQPVGEVVRVERVARGIHASHDRGEDFDNEPQAVQDEYLDMARAALAAAMEG